MSRQALGPTQPPVQWEPVFPGETRSGRGVDHPPPSTVEVKERVNLYLYSYLWAFLSCSRIIFIVIQNTISIFTDRKASDLTFNVCDFCRELNRLTASVCIGPDNSGLQAVGGVEKFHVHEREREKERGGGSCDIAERAANS
jgi:hypothetical protein